jgi:hypothetical protein
MIFSIPNPSHKVNLDLTKPTNIILDAVFKMGFFLMDRLFKLYLFHPLMLIRPQRKKLQIPILMYHSISESGENYGHPYFQTNTSPKAFDEHMKFLYENNYSVIRLQDISEYFIDEKGGDYKPIIITFDDGFAEFYTEALQILSQYNFGVTVFLHTGFIGENKMRIDGKERLCWREVRECQAAGLHLAPIPLVTSSFHF